MIYTVLGIFESLATTEELLLQAQEAGFSLERISVIFYHPDQHSQQHTLSLTRLLDVDTITLPDHRSPLDIAGPFKASFGLRGATRATINDAATGLVAGGIAGALLGLGVSKHHAKTIDRALVQGKILIGLPATDEQIAFIQQLFSQHRCLQSAVMKTPTQQYPYLLSSLLFEYTKPVDTSAKMYVGAKGGKQSKSQATKKR